MEGAWGWNAYWPGDAPVDQSSDEAFDDLISSSRRRVRHDLVILMILLRLCHPNRCMLSRFLYPEKCKRIIRIEVMADAAAATTDEVV